MEKLPKSLDAEHLARREIPGDMTLKESRDFLVTMHSFKALLAQVKNPGDVVISFFVGGRLAPDDMTVREWRRLHGTMSVDDKNGGALVRMPEKV